MRFVEYKPPSIKEAGAEMRIQQCLKGERAMTFSEAINIKFANVDRTTGERLSHREIYARAINVLGGLDAVIPYIPFTLSEIQKALETDKYLNNLSMEKWNAASGFHCFINRRTKVQEFVPNGMCHCPINR